MVDKPTEVQWKYNPWFCLIHPYDLLQMSYRLILVTLKWRRIRILQILLPGRTDCPGLVLPCSSMWC